MTANDTILPVTESNEGEDNNEITNKNLTCNKKRINFLSTNARSLCPKIKSLITHMEELDVDFSVVTESWLVDGKGLDEDLLDLEAGSNLKVLYKNRPAKLTNRQKRRTAGGGVTIVYDTKRCDFKERKMAGNKYEIVSGVCTVPKLSLIHI